MQCTLIRALYRLDNECHVNILFVEWNARLPDFNRLNALLIISHIISGGSEWTRTDSVIGDSSFLVEIS